MEHKMRQFSNSLTFYFRILGSYYLTDLPPSSVSSWEDEGGDRFLQDPLPPYPSLRPEPPSLRWKEAASFREEEEEAPSFFQEAPPGIV